MTTCSWCPEPATGTALGWFTIMQMRVASCGRGQHGLEFIPTEES